MPYKDNQPTFNVNRNVVNFKDFTSNIEGEKEELKKIRRSIKPNSEDQQHIGNSKYKYNKVTHKMDDISKEMLDDEIEYIEELEESKINERLSSDEKESICGTIDNEGFSYAFVDYTDYKEIDDVKFHELRKNFIDAYKKLSKYVGWDKFEG